MKIQRWRSNIFDQCWMASTPLSATISFSLTSCPPKAVPVQPAKGAHMPANPTQCSIGHHQKHSMIIKVDTMSAGGGTPVLLLCMTTS
jgi:hypothetical protein